MTKSDWTRNQKILLWTLIVFVIFNTFFTIISIFSLYSNQSEIRQEIIGIKADIGEFRTISATNANFGSLNVTCPPGTTPGTTTFSNGQILFKCEDKTIK